MPILHSIVIGEVFRDPNSDSARVFKQDLERLLKTPKRLLAGSLERLPSVRLAPTQKQTRDIVRAFADEYEWGFAEAATNFELLLFFLSRIMQSDLPEDDTEQWVDDLKTAGAISSEDQASVFREIIGSLRDLSEGDIKREIQRRKSADSVSPSFAGYSIAASIQGVFERQISSGMSADEYESEVRDIVPIVTVNILLDMGSAPDKKVTFHASESDLEVLINALKAGKKDIRELKRFLSIKGE